MGKHSFADKDTMFRGQRRPSNDKYRHLFVSIIARKEAIFFDCAREALDKYPEAVTFYMADAAKGMRGRQDVYATAIDVHPMSAAKKAVRAMLVQLAFKQDGSPISRKLWVGPWPVSKNGNEWCRAFGLTYTLIREANGVTRVVMVGPKGAREDARLPITLEGAKNHLWPEGLDAPWDMFGVLQGMTPEAKSGIIPVKSRP